MVDQLKKPQIIAHIEKSMNFSIFDTKWIPLSAKFVVMGSKPNGNGIVKIFELNSGDLDLVKEFEGKSSYKCGSFNASSLRQPELAVGDFDGNLSIFDLEKTSKPKFQVGAHKGIINSIDAVGGASVTCGAPEIVTGGRDGTVKVWDPRQSDGPVACISTEENAETRDCWCVAFGDSHNNEERAVCAGYDNGDVKLFDLRSMKQKWDCNVKNGVCSIEFDRRDIKMNKMVVTTLEGGLHVYDMRTQHKNKGFACVSEKDAGRSLGTNGVVSGAKSTVWCAKHLPQNRDIFISCGGSGSIRLWHYNYPSKRSKELSDGSLQGVAGTLDMLQAVTLSMQPINCFDWSPDNTGLGVCGAFDQTIRVLVTTKLNLY